MTQGTELTRRRFLVLAGLGGLGGGLALTACGSAPAATPTATAAARTGAPATTAPAATVAAATPAIGKPELASFPYGIDLPNYIGNAPHLVAIEKGYYKGVGLEQIEAVATSDVIPGIISGKLLLAQGDTDPTLLATTKGQALVWLAAHQDKEFRIVMGGKGINTIADLKGKRVNGGAGGVDGRPAFIVREQLRLAGLDPVKDVEWVYVGTDAALQQIIAGQLAGSIAQPRHEQPLQAAGGKFLTSAVAEAPQSGIFAKLETVQKYPNTVAAFLAANIRARQWMIKDKATILATQTELFAMMEKYGFKMTDPIKATHEASMSTLSVDAGFNAAALDKLVAESKGLGSLPKDLDWRKVVDVGPLNKAQTVAGVAVRPKL